MLWSIDHPAWSPISAVSANPNDLSRSHTPLTRLFFGLGAEGVAEKYTLSEQQIAFFNENGYLADYRLIFHAQVDALRAQLGGLIEPTPEINRVLHTFNDAPPADSGKTLFHASGAWRVKQGFHDLLWAGSLLTPAIQLLGGNVRLWQDQVFVKAPQTGAAIGWHQEAAYWSNISPIQHLICWIALDNMTEANGCLRVVPGSHKWGLVPGQPAAPGQDLGAIQSLLTPEQKAEFRDVPLPMKKGWCVFMSPYLLHASGENTTEDVRRALSVTLMKSGVKTETSDPVLPGVPAIKKGKKLDGPCFPVLYKAPKEEAVGAGAEGGEG